MAESERKPEKARTTTGEQWGVHDLKREAVAVDPPPAGAIGIQELLNRFDGFAEANELFDSPPTSIIGVRELLARLSNLAEAGNFSSSEREASDDD